MHLGISYKATFPEAPINAFKSEVEAPGLEVFVEKTPANEIYAGLEWLLPTAAVVYIYEILF
jgi:hypothetical protein